MIFRLLNIFDRFFSFTVARAHCDIPCEIYDPIEAQVACLTIIRLNDIIGELEENKPNMVKYVSQVSRLTAQKEEHGKIVKEAVRVIWGDYFKTPQIQAHPEVHELVHGIMLMASKAKQNVDRDAALELLEKVNTFAEIFWKTKEVSTYRAICPYPPSVEVVYPDLRD